MEADKLRYSVIEAGIEA